MVNPKVDEAGFAMALALMVLLLLGSAIGIAVTTVAIEGHQLARDARMVKADALADAAIAETLAALAANPDSNGVPGHLFAGGWIESKARRTGRLVAISVHVEIGAVHREIDIRAELVERRPRVLGWQPASDSRVLTNRRAR